MTATNHESPSAPSGSEAAILPGGLADTMETEKNVALFHEMLRETVGEILSDLAAAKDGSLRAMMDAVGIANMEGANLASVDLRGEDLSGISFAGADLSKADLRDCDLRRCDFSGAILDGASFEGALQSPIYDWQSMSVAEITHALAEVRRIAAAPRPIVASAKPARGLFPLLAKILSGRAMTRGPLPAQPLVPATPPARPAKAAAPQEHVRVASPTTTRA